MAVMAIAGAVVVADHSSQEHGAAGTTASNERAAAAMAEENRLSGNETHAQLSASDSGQESDVGACSAKELSKEVLSYAELIEHHPELKPSQDRVVCKEATFTGIDTQT